MPHRKAILVVGRNLFFLPRIQNVASPSGYEVKLTATAPKFWETYDEGDTALVLVDLEGDKDTWTAVVRGLRERVPPVSKVSLSDLTRTSSPWNWQERWAVMPY